MLMALSSFKQIHFTTVSGALPDVDLLPPRPSVRVVWPHRGVAAVLKEELMFASR